MIVYIHVLKKKKKKKIRVLDNRTNPSNTVDHSSDHREELIEQEGPT
jgi:hypothetical protein